MSSQIYGRPFQIITGTISIAGDPSVGRNPIVSNRYHKAGPVLTTPRLQHRYLSSNPTTPSVGTITIGDNTFDPGEVLIITLGDHQLVSNIDFVPGLDTDATAANISTAINLLYDWFSTVVGSVITVYQYPGLGLIPFSVQSLGTVVHATVLPTGNYLTEAIPSFGPPLRG